MRLTTSQAVQTANLYRPGGLLLSADATGRTNGGEIVGYGVLQNVYSACENRTKTDPKNMCDAQAVSEFFVRTNFQGDIFAMNISGISRSFFHC